MAAQDFNEFTGCTAISCSRLMTGPKSWTNYRIREECRYAQNGSCPYPDKKKYKGQESNEMASNG